MDPLCLDRVKVPSVMFSAEMLMLNFSLLRVTVTFTCVEQKLRTDQCSAAIINTEWLPGELIPSVVNALFGVDQQRYSVSPSVLAQLRRRLPAGQNGGVREYGWRRLCRAKWRNTGVEM